MGEPIVRLDGVDLGYGSRAVLKDVHLDVGEADFLGIVGPNGAGKTTLLRTILGLLHPVRGRVDYRGGRAAIRFGYVPQRETVDAVFPISALEMVLLNRAAIKGALRPIGKADRGKAMESLEHVGIAHLADKRFRDLSGGQMQRVLIARALAAEPRVLLLDEPTNGMDLESEHSLMELVRSLHDSDGLTVIMVSHLLNVVVNYVKQIVLVDREHFIAGPIDSVLTEANLERMYGVGVTIARVDDRRVVMPCREEHRA